MRTGSPKWDFDDIWLTALAWGIILGGLGLAIAWKLYS